MFSKCAPHFSLNDEPFRNEISIWKTYKFKHENLLQITQTASGISLLLTAAVCPKSCEVLKYDCNVIFFPLPHSLKTGSVQLTNRKWIKNFGTFTITASTFSINKCKAYTAIHLHLQLLFHITFYSNTH